MIRIGGHDIEAYVFDTETTGLGKDDEVLSIGICDETGSPIIGTLVRPLAHSSWPDAERINHIDPDMLAAAPTLTDVLLDMREKGLIGSKADYVCLVGYNVDFDVRMVVQSSELLRQSGFFCTGDAMPLSIRHQFDNAEYAYATLLTDKPLIIVDAMAPACAKMGVWDDRHNDWKRQKLVSVADTIGYEWGEETAHDSLSDARATAAVFRWICEGNSKIRFVASSASTDYPDLGA